MNFTIGARALGLAYAAVILFAPANTTPKTNRSSLAATQPLRADMTAARYAAATKRLQEFYRVLLAALSSDSQAGIFTIEPPRQLSHGYQILPKITAGQSAHQKTSSPTGYSWPWTDKLISDASRDITQLEVGLRELPALDRGARRKLFERAVQGYLQLRSRMQNIDAHIQYNRLWQTAIARDRASFDRETSRYYWVVERDSLRQSLLSLDAAGARSELNWFDAFPGVALLEERLKTRATALTNAIDSDATPPDVPSFLQVEQRSNGWIVKVPVYTDIDDPEFIRGFKEKSEKIWHVRKGNVDFSVALDITFIVPADLYRGATVPARGTSIDVERHIALFPKDGAVLTTGAVSTHVFGRAIVLGAHDIDERILAHEVGHILGFRDSYVRGYKDLGANGFAVLEAVVDPSDIMGRSDIGAVLPRHFEKILQQIVIKRTNAKSDEQKDGQVPRQQFAAAGTRHNPPLRSVNFAAAARSCDDSHNHHRQHTQPNQQRDRRIHA